MLKKHAQEITGGLSKPGKMPGPSFSISAMDCQTGQRLRTSVPDSVCASCYACKGNYVRYPAIRTAQDRRKAGIDRATTDSAYRAQWLDAMRTLIGKHKHFRFFDAGDLQGVRYVELFCELAASIPDVAFWLPTKEPRFVKRFVQTGGSIPANLVIRISAPRVNQAPVAGFANTSTVHTDSAFGHECDAYERDGKCGDCRACWNPDIKNISYPKH